MRRRQILSRKKAQARPETPHEAYERKFGRAGDTLLSPRQVRLLLRLDEGTGRVFWRDRPEIDGESAAVRARMNGRLSGREAFTTKHNGGYLMGRMFGRNYYAHRIVWCLKHGEWPEAYVDHVNFDKTDNRPDNLRAATHSENQRHREKPSGASRYWGVTPKAGKYQAQVKTESGAPHYIGLFNTELEAARAYDAVAPKMGGPRARLNFVGG